MASFLGRLSGREPIVSAQQAEGNLRMTGGCLAVLAALSGLTFIGHMDAGRIMTTLLLGIPALALYRGYSLWAARMLFGVATFCVVMMIGMVPYGLWQHDMAITTLCAILLPLYVFFALAMRRSAEAAQYLRAHRRALSEHSAVTVDLA